jgi:hypothetical protein
MKWTAYLWTVNALPLCQLKQLHLFLNLTIVSTITLPLTRCQTNEITDNGFEIHYLSLKKPCKEKLSILS